MATPALEESSRLAGIPVHVLRDRLELARTSLRLGQTRFTRMNAIREIETVRAELQRRGYWVAP